MYHPWRHLLSLGQGVTYSIEPTPGDKPAWWSPRWDHILIRPGQTQVERRCHLAHELAHRDLGHSGECGGWLGRRTTKRQEREADSLAARRLIKLEALVDALCWSDERETVADYLWVTEHMLDVRIETMYGGERRVVREELEKRAPEGGWGA
jgi:hypothetical protein